MPKKIILTAEEYRRLSSDALLLAMLKNFGVDNWEGYEDAVEAFQKKEEDLEQAIQGDIQGGPYESMLDMHKALILWAALPEDHPAGSKSDLLYHLLLPVMSVVAHEDPDWKMFQEEWNES